MKKIPALLLALLMLAFSCCSAEILPAEEILVDGEFAMTEELTLEYGWDYYTLEEVALYIHVFWELPPNFITKDEAYDLGWNSREGNLWDVAYGMVIGGDRFGNREGLLPDDGERQWYECDVNYEGGYRGAERVLFSSDGLVYYTVDHYESFEPLYEGWFGDEEGTYIYDDAYFEYGNYGY